MTERYFKFDVNEFRDRKCNFHSHTKRCKHAGGEEREYVEAAIAEGYEVIGFSDHSPYLFEHGYVSGIRMDMRELEGYVRTVEELKREYRKDIEIYVALEMEYFPPLFDRTMEEIRQYPLDYMLLAQHFFYEGERFISTRREWVDEKHLSDYVGLLETALDTGYFNLVAHPDIFHFCGDPELYTKYMTKLVNRLKEEQIPIEVNVNGFRCGINYPDERFVKLGAACGSEFLVGVDAHHPKEYADHTSYDGCVKLAEKFGGRVLWK